MLHPRQNHPTDCFHCLVKAQVLLVAKSTFSIVAAMLAGPTQVRIYPPMPKQAGLWEHHKAGKAWLVSTLSGKINQAQLEQQLKRAV